MTTKFLPYEHVPAGFEMVIENSEARAWGLWFNLTLSDDPGKWDDEIRAINAQQRHLGDLTDDQRLIRAHMAEFCRRQPIYPESVSILCREIRQGRLSEPLLLGCEGRGLLASLGYREPEAMTAQWRQRLRDYAHALRRWQEGEPPANPIETRVHAFLGDANGSVEPVVNELLALLEPDSPERNAIKMLSERICISRRGEGILQRPAPFPFGCLTCGDWEAEEPMCNCSPVMILDAALLCAGPAADREGMAQTYRGLIQEYVLAYALALNAWLEGTPPELGAWPQEAVHLSAQEVGRVADDVAKWLGERDDIKVWLGMCLLKTVAGNQRWHGRDELIDHVPAATRWLRELCESPA